ncbi:hypothetical protein ACU686_23645 [Yinghuangia aomiensis]
MPDGDSPSSAASGVAGPDVPPSAELGAAPEPSEAGPAAPAPSDEPAAKPANPVPQLASGVRRAAREVAEQPEQRVGGLPHRFPVRIGGRLRLGPHRGVAVVVPARVVARHDLREVRAVRPALQLLRPGRRGTGASVRSRSSA